MATLLGCGSAGTTDNCEPFEGVYRVFVSTDSSECGPAIRERSEVVIRPDYQDGTPVLAGVCRVALERTCDDVRLQQACPPGAGVAIDVTLQRDSSGGASIEGTYTNETGCTQPLWMTLDRLADPPLLDVDGGL